MRTFSRTTRFKKDVKLAGKRGEDLEKLKVVLDLLINGDELPARCRDHPLRGNFAGSRDCHIEPDWLLIYTLTENGDHVRFERTGTTAICFARIVFPLSLFPLFAPVQDSVPYSRVTHKSNDVPAWRESFVK